MTLAKPYEAPMMPVKAGRFLGGAEKAMIVYAPAPRPAAPRPAMARPVMRASALGAAPQMTEPSSKMMMERMKVVLRGKYLYALPPDELNSVSGWS
jgi:hypothetical protein